MKTIKNIVIVGGGTAGWISAALLKKILGNVIDVTLVESDAIGTVGVGEATIPPIQHLNAVLGLDEAEFIRETKATIKLAIKFENWHTQGEDYFHTFGAPGQTLPFCYFHHLWKRAKDLGMKNSLWDFDLNYHSAVAGKFAKISSKDPMLDMPYAYHFDAGLYAKFLRKVSERMGVKRIEGLIEHADVDPHNGNVTTLTLKSGQTIDGDFFIDCSGFRGLLIQGKVGAGFEDWSHWLPCDRAIAVPSQRHENTAPYTRSIAHGAGWQWQIPLQHRNGNGLVFSSAHYTTEQATDILLQNIGTEPLAEPREIRFRTGRARKQWQRNVLAVGLASGFIEPLESTSIHLIQAAIVRFAKLFPHVGISDALRNEYNQQSQVEYEQIRDFIILHYHANARDDSQFWRDMRAMDIPDSLRHKMELFKQVGHIYREKDDLFAEASWLQVLMGQGITPEDIHPSANAMPDDQLMALMQKLLRGKTEPVKKMPSHDQFLSMFTGVDVSVNNQGERHAKHA